jgi:serine/threonine protein kinase
MTVLGTLPYMSPLARLNLPHDTFKSDVFSLGLSLLYAALLKKDEDWNRDNDLLEKSL